MIRTLSGMIVAAALLAGCSSQPANGNKQRIVATETRIQLGMAYLAEGNLPAARYHFDKVLRAKPDHYQAQLGMALYEQYSGQPEAARQRYKIAMQYAPGNDTVLHHYSAFLCEQGQHEEAKMLFAGSNADRRICYQ
ncbi:tetratricopeptide repeat protein [Photorhabdus heterorhabditis]|uniref:Fimbrial assembly protein n=1 Tax=Photorhabdus heterorhabditis TaxID=880156 RepID=A0ABR5KBC7_9GAMM|nr:tetratricopeptide repeat protein [Photorhabdus heterorhabditis]KOY61876.1 fimbrial assembly protein [Photorhabdus heterorhabditis]MBS9441894.1 fimbrial assembly protein [Photorhabdus heterorhabditis]